LGVSHVPCPKGSRVPASPKFLRPHAHSKRNNDQLLYDERTRFLRNNFAGSTTNATSDLFAVANLNCYCVKIRHKNVCAQMYVALTCQKDLDSLIQLLNDTGSKRAHIYIRLFEEPPSVSSVSSVFIQSPEAQSEMRVCFWTASL